VQAGSARDPEAQLVPSQNKPISPQVGRALGQSATLGNINLDRQARSDDGSDFVLKREEIGEVSLVALGPDDTVIYGINEPDVDPDLLARLHQPTGEDVADAEQPR
jgi:hypothetical protein